ncbi:MAG TPA: hypothetical protein VGW34_13325 [Allosphingosinicella sp.]|nr:hypothetical protein [Allosphingosinicella sp.]
MNGAGNVTIDLPGKRRTEVTDPLGKVREYVSDLSLRRVESVKDELLYVTSFSYDGFGRLTGTELPEGNGVQFTYDGRGNVTERRAQAKTDSGLADIVTSAVFPATCANPKTCNKPTSTTDARGFTTNYTYGSVHGGLLTVTAPAPSAGAEAVRPQLRYSYAPRSARYKDATGAYVDGSPVYRLTAVSTCQTLASCTGADEVKTTIGYGSGTSANNLVPTSVTVGAGDDSLSATTSYAYDDFGRLASVDGPLAGTGDTFRYRYDAAGRRVGTILPDPDGAGPLKRRAQRVVHDFEGLQTIVESGTVEGLTDADWAAFQPLENVRTSFDRSGRTTRVALRVGSATHAVTHYGYDAAGRLECTAVRMNETKLGGPFGTACEPDAEGGHGPDRIVRTLYTVRGEPARIDAGFGTDAVRREASFTYSANGRLRIVTDGEDNKTSFAYDGHDRLFRTRYPVKAKGDGNVAANDYEELGYDAGSNVVSRKLRDNDDDYAPDNPVIAFTYDNLGRLTKKDLPGSEPDVTYGYDNLGRMLGASQAGHTLSFTYDALGRNLTQAGPLGTIVYGHDIAGRRTRTWWADGFSVTYDHLVTGEVTTISEYENLEDSSPFVLATYGYDDLGRRTSITRGNGATTSYAYGAVSRLGELGHDLAGTSADLTLGFTYNPAGQIATNSRSRDAFRLLAPPAGSTAYETGGLNQLLSVGAAAVTHDGRGNLTSDGTRTFGYSSENLLTSGPNNASLTYDPLMRLHRVSATGFMAKSFAYDGLDLIAEYDDTARRSIRLYRLRKLV